MFTYHTSKLSALAGSNAVPRACFSGTGTVVLSSNGVSAFGRVIAHVLMARALASKCVLMNRLFHAQELHEQDCIPWPCSKCSRASSIAGLPVMDVALITCIIFAAFSMHLSRSA